MASANEPHRSFLISFGLEKIGLVPLVAPVVTLLLAIALTAAAVAGLGRLKVDDSLTELFRTDTPEFRQYETIDKRFPSSEYDVLAVIEGPALLQRPQLSAFSELAAELQLVDGVAGVVSMLSARGIPDASGYAPPIVPDELPEDEAAFQQVVTTLRENEIVKGKFLSDDGELALIVVSLDRAVVAEKTAAVVIGEINETVSKYLDGKGLRSKLTGAPVMQLEIRNAVERDYLLYNGLGLLFGATIAGIFFRRISLMLVAALPPLLAVVWSLGLLGWLDFRLNLFLNVMTPLIMVMGFADSMQMVSAIRIRLREGDTRQEAVRFAVKVVGPACVLAHGVVLVSFLALLLSDSGLIFTFGAAGAIATLISFIAVIIVLPVLGVLLIRNEAQLARDRTPADHLMDSLGGLVGWIVDRVVRRPVLYSLSGLALFAFFCWSFYELDPKYRLADQVPDREQALQGTGSLDQKLTGANPFHVMIEWKDGTPLFSPVPLEVISKTQAVLETQAGLGNIWSVESLRRWLEKAGDGSPAAVERVVGILPEHLVRRFIADKRDAVLVTGRLPDIDSAQILPVVEKIDKALDEVRAAHPGFEISVTGLPAIAARNSARMIGQLKESLPICVALAAVILGLAFRSPFVALISLLPGLFPVAAASTWLWYTGAGLEFASIVALLVVFGLGVDALIHFLNRLKLEERPGDPPENAIRRARILVGPAIILTTIVLAFGLGITIFSDLPSLRTFGLVCGLTLLASLVADLVFLPATIMLGRRLFPAST